MPAPPLVPAGALALDENFGERLRRGVRQCAPGADLHSHRLLAGQPYAAEGIACSCHVNSVPHAAIRKAMRGEPSIDWLLENQDKIVHSYHQKGLEGKL